MTRLKSLFTLALLVLAGCGGSTVAIDGQLVENGKAIALKEGENIIISMSDGAKSASATVGADGKFSAKAVSLGSYRVTVTRYPIPDGKSSSSKSSAPITKSLSETWAVEAGKPNTYTLDLSNLK